MSVHSVGADQLRPAQDDCGACGCCTRALCERGRKDVLGCAGVAAPDSVAVVQDCPCSAETMPGTAAYDDARFRAAMHAEKRPLPVTSESQLRALAVGLPVGANEAGLGVLRVFRYVADTDTDTDGPGGGVRVTDLGRMYLRARDGGR